jgi:hypothetical protein
MRASSAWLIAIVVVAVIIGSAAFYYINNQQAQAAFQNNLKCQSLGKTWLNGPGMVDLPFFTGTGLLPNYQFHYNKKLGTCLIALINDFDSNDGSHIQNDYVLNLLSNNMIIGFHGFQTASGSIHFGLGTLGASSTENDFVSQEKQLMAE